MSYALGTTHPPTAINTLLATNTATGNRTPRSRFYEAGEEVDRLDAQVAGLGFPVAIWTFDILSQTMIDNLRAVCPGHSATVYLTTDKLDGTFETYTAVMVWPRNQMDSRQIGEKYLGLEFVFRRLEVYP